MAEEIDVGHFLRDQLTSKQQALLPSTIRSAYQQF
jgi:hypothetical protein